MRTYNKSDIASAFACSFCEESLLVLSAADEDKGIYTEFALLHLGEAPLSEAEIQAWSLRVPRLRDVFIHEKVEKPLRIRLKALDLDFKALQLPLYQQKSAAASVWEWVATADWHFDVQNPPLFCLRAIEIVGQHFLLLAYHHLLFDGISVQYALSLLKTGTENHYIDWKPNLPSSFPQHETPKSSFRLQDYLLPAAIGSEGYEYIDIPLPEGQSYQQTMAHWLQFLQQATGQDEILLGEVFSARGAEGAGQAAMGYFVQTWPLLLQLKENERVENLALRLQAEREKLQNLAHLPLNKVMPGAGFDTCWVVEPSVQTEIAVEFRSRPHYVLSLIFKGSSLNLTWNCAKVDAAAAREITKSFALYLQEGGFNSAVQLPDFQPKAASILHLWDAIVEKFGDKPAVGDHHGNIYSYKALDAAATRLAAALPVQLGETVGVRMSYSANILIAYLAILKKGAIYVPLDPSIAKARYDYILKDAGIKIIISDLAEACDLPLFHPIQEEANIADFKPYSPRGEDICYLIYTSGTTGAPKGCAVTHRNLVNLFEGAAARFAFSSEDRWILAHSYGFDFSTWEIWGALLSGAYLWIPDKTEVQDSFNFYDIVQQQAITVLNQTPRAFDNLILVSEGEKTLDKLRYLIFGGDKLNINKIEPWLQKHPALKAINMYGITETTVHVTYQEISASAQSNIGLPLPGYTLHCCNSRRQPIPQGFVGELRVGGYGLCTGYYGKPELTAEKFNYSGIVPYYFSGDLGCSAEGSFYYVGRNDRQVKIRGYRIELGEIESLMEKQLQAVKIRTLFIDAQHLVAFHTPCSLHLTRALFQTILPDYAIPNFFISLPAIPLNENGKTDEAALINIFRASQDKKTTIHTENPLQKVLVQVLGDKLDLNRSFVQNGGDSILAIRLINNLKKEGFKISVSALFEANALRELKAENIIKEPDNQFEIEKLAQSLKNKYETATGKKALAVYPLLDAQLGILFDALASDDSGTYVEQLSYELPNTYSIEQLKTAYQRLFAALPALRLQIGKLEEDYVWILNDNQAIIQERDFSALPDAEEEWKRYLEKDFGQGFELFGSLIRLSVICMKGEIRLIWTHHHLLLDGWSLGAFSRLFIGALQGKAIAENSSKPYLDYLLSQALSSNKQGAMLPYWNNRLSGLETDPLIPYSGNAEAKGIREYILKIEGENAQKLAASGLTANVYALAAWICYLKRCFDKTDIALGAVQSRRNAGLNDAIGMLIKTLPFRYRFVEQKQSFLEIALEIARLQRSDFENLDAPLQELSQAGEVLAHLFVFENYPIDKDLVSNSGIKIGAYREQTAADWATIVYPETSGFSLRVLAKETRYAPDYIEALLQGFAQWMQLLQLNTIIDTLDFVPKGTSSFAGEKRPDFEARQHILQILAPASNKIFMLQNGETKTYTWLWTEAEKWAKQLKTEGLEKGQAVAIEVHSSLDFSVAILAVWMAEGVCCSVDYRYPESRKEFIWQNAACFLKFYGNADAKFHLQQIAPKNNITHSAKASFILHTSGSTGQPKGVIQTHACLLNLIAWNRENFGLNEAERILQLSSFGFDASYHEVLLALSLGATMVEMPLTQRLDIQAIRASIVANEVSLAWIPARLLNAVLDADATYFDACKSLKNIVTTGEALTIGDALNAWLQGSGITLLNYYGPTETHVVTALAVNRDNSSALPPIGKPLSNAIIRLCDAEGREVLKGLPGELWVAGPYLAIGYLNLPEQTTERFVELEAQRWYKTGDRARMRIDGLLEYLGRKDEQVKIRGFRVEPIEVERLLLQLPSIRQACILVEKGTEIRLLAFYVGEAAEAETLRTACAGIMPDYMIPSLFFALEAIPLNENGKADRKKLKQIYIDTKKEQGEELPTTIAVSCWTALLGHRNFDMQSSFQSVGGNSIMFMKMQAWLEKQEGLSFAIRELIQANRPALLDALILSKRAEKATLSELPLRFPLNSFQRAILWNELGNNYEKSPYLLRFTVALKQDLTLADLEAAWAKLLQQYPHLGYGIECSEDLRNADWLQTRAAIADFFCSFPEGKISLQGPLIRLWLQENKLSVSWHHLLLDGLGLQTTMQALLGILSGKPIKQNIDFKSIVMPELLEQKILVTSSNAPAKIAEQVFDAAFFNEILAYCQLHQVTLFHFLLAALHLQIQQQEGKQKTAIAYTDARAASGLPGMFTFLNASVLDWTEINTLKQLWAAIADSLQQTATVSESLHRVVNFMDDELPTELVAGYWADNPSICKYPLEYQWIKRASTFSTTLIFEAWNAAAEQEQQAFLLECKKLLEISIGDKLQLHQAAKALPELGDFDF